MIQLAINQEDRMPNTTGILMPIIPFDLLIDLDYGLIKLIAEAYRDDSVFDLEICDLYYKQLIIKLIERRDKNPLSIIMKKTKDPDLKRMYNDLKEEYYKNFMEEELWNICTKSMYTAIETAVANFLKVEGIDPTVLCRNETELKFIESIPELKNVKTLLGDYDSIDPEVYDIIYFKNFEDILKIQSKIYAKNLYVAEYDFNLEKRRRGEEPVLRKDLSILFLDANQAVVMGVYPIDETYYYVG